MTEKKFNCLIMGAAGRDFHDFQSFFKQRPEFHVVAFTAAQIPFIETRSFPRELAGKYYATDIPIHSESKLPELIAAHQIDFVFLAYSDLSFDDVMHKASLVQSLGASFVLLGPRHTQLESGKPVVSVTAVRTGAGKSPLSQMLTRHLKQAGFRVGVIRHPMPYGDLTRQAVERFATEEDLDRYHCTVEEREEYEPYVEQGLTIFAGVNYQQVLRSAEQQSDVILWDGGNNDYPFLRAGLSIVVADALRAGHEISYYPGETNLRRADIVVINKVAQADDRELSELRQRISQTNPRATIVTADLEIEVADPDPIQGRRVLVVEDGPTVTHGGMAYGAGWLAAQRFGAAEIIDPRPAAVGTIAKSFADYPHLENVLPALGYSPQQCRELRETIEKSGAEVVIDASPAHLDRVIQLSIPIVRVRYRFEQKSGKPLTDTVAEFVKAHV